MIKAGIIGVTGYVGVELLRLLQHHPSVDVVLGMSPSSAGDEISNLYPHLGKQFSLIAQPLDLDLVIQQCDLVFIALPHGHAIDIVQPLLSAGIKVIDLGADFRLKNPKLYEQYYQHLPAKQALLDQAVYGLPEIGNKSEIQKASLIANPGCYPTATILSALPALKAGIVSVEDCVFDAKSGISGAGKTPTANTHFCEIADTVVPYQIASHRHIPEIEQALSEIVGNAIKVQFTPHLIPIIRGLLVTAYLKLQHTMSLEEVIHIYQTAYQDHPFIQVTTQIPHMKYVNGTNMCMLGIKLDTRTQRLIIVSVIDNLIKGAAGQAIQNMNLMCQLSETMGLDNILATYP